jgi:hypothetical protein
VVETSRLRRDVGIGREASVIYRDDREFAGALRLLARDSLR